MWGCGRRLLRDERRGSRVQRYPDGRRRDRARRLAWAPCRIRSPPWSNCPVCSRPVTRRARRWVGPIGTVPIFAAGRSPLPRPRYAPPGPRRCSTADRCSFPPMAVVIRCLPARCGWPRRSKVARGHWSGCGAARRCRRWRGCMRWRPVTSSTTTPWAARAATWTPVVARAVSRLITIASGLDPHGLGVPEVHWMRRSGDYRAAARGFASGTPDGLAAWLVLSAEALHAGAREALAIAVAMSS